MRYMVSYHTLPNIGEVFGQSGNICFNTLLERDKFIAAHQPYWVLYTISILRGTK